MERISERERALLGYAPGSADGGGVGVGDFRDVFGGPPRRYSSSVNESRRSRRESLDSYSPRERWSGSGSRLLEKPVFGGGSGSPASRRSPLGDDFYSDIFPGSDSACSSPMKPDRDPFSSSPSSRINSTRREALSGGAALPAQLSLSMKLAKATDYPTLNSPTQRALYKKDLGSADSLGFPYSPSATSRAVSENYDVNIDGQAFYRQSLLSRQLSSGFETYLEVNDSSSIGMEVQPKMDKMSLDALVGCGRTHFSFYKWAGKGVTLIMPSNAKEKSSSRLARLPEVVVQAIELPLYNDDIPTATTPSKKSPSGSKNSMLLKDIFTDKNELPVSTTAEKRLTDGFESKSLHSNVTADSDAYNKNSRRTQVTMSDKQKLETENLHQLFNDGFDKQGNGDIVKQSEEKKSSSKSRRNVHEVANAKEQEGRENSMKNVEVASPIMQDVQVPLEDKMLGNRVNSVKGKVKEFIKIFNHESSPKRKGTFESQTRRSRGKDQMDGKIEDKVSTPAMKMAVDTKATKGNNKKSLLDTPTGITQISVAEKPYSMGSDIHMLNEPSAERNATSETFFDSTPEVIEASLSDIEESHSDDLDGCFVDRLSQDQSDKLQTDSPPDQIKTSDAKIREWSKGKEGNIRSLLSTLQYVLWPESGWKPVPLVDIIEGTSVKRAYQKALLCLHPDKLQQKGAATHQKYIAEKVFDILQEAWNHFNSITSF